MSQNGESSYKRSDEIRQEIDATRQQMDQTIDALADRFKGRHVIDEVIGIFRSNVSDENVVKIKDKVTQTTNSAVNSVVSTVKSNPWPTLLIGAGVAWLIYNSRRSNESRYGDSEYLESPYESDLSDEAGYELSGGGYGAGGLADDYDSADLTANASGELEQAGSGLASKFDDVKSTVREKAGQAGEQIRDKASQVGQQLRDKSQQVRQRASELGSRVQQRSREVYERSRERVVTTANQHPLEVGLGILALGIVAGLAIPTPEKVNQLVGPRADRLRERAREAGRDIVTRGKTVVQAAANAAKQEAASQGITPEALREKAKAVAKRTKQVATDKAREEGVIPEENGADAPQPAGQA